ncbi:MAG: hypothetical protein CMJ40_01020 [Phycisphaerae bacterium]|nr:hypothetical protein [Phycisphaerae bacterium]|tara:strand:+ start:1276 stop:1773 length:498 start_codon:yes stop_codon:yes gene_type:complete
MATWNSTSTFEPSQHDLSSVNTVEQTRELIRSAGLRCTRQRVAIYEHLRRSSHPTAEAIHGRVIREQPVSLATVYNTLDIFTKAGLILQLPSRSGTSRYCAGQASHMHLQIDDTGELEDVPPELGERIIDAMPNEILSEIESRMGVKIRGIDIQFTGSRDSGESS